MFKKDKSCCKKNRKSNRFIDGRTLKTYYCLDCNKEISYTCALYTSHKCKSCSQKGKKHTKKTKDKIKKLRKGKKWSKIIKQKISQSHIGLKHTEKSKRKQSLSHGGTGIPYELTEYGSEFDNKLKEQVRFRDNYECQVCGCSQLENGRQLDCHHIDYNKMNNLLINLIALCHKCHMKTNNNRKYWKEYFYVFST